MMARVATADPDRAIRGSTGAGSNSPIAPGQLPDSGAFDAGSGAPTAVIDGATSTCSDVSTVECEARVGSNGLHEVACVAPKAITGLVLSRANAPNAAVAMKPHGCAFVASLPPESGYVVVRNIDAINVVAAVVEGPPLPNARDLVRAPLPAPQPSDASTPQPPNIYFGFGVVAGFARSSDPFAASPILGVAAEMGVRLVGPVWLHGLGAVGLESFEQLRGGTELRLCGSNGSTCVHAGVDVGWQQLGYEIEGCDGEFDDGPTQYTSETTTSAVVTPRVGIEWGQDVRAQLSGELNIDSGGTGFVLTFTLGGRE
jgi:hypothetical protein